MVESTEATRSDTRRWSAEAGHYRARGSDAQPASLSATNASTEHAPQHRGDPDNAVGALPVGPSGNGQHHNDDCALVCSSSVTTQRRHRFHQRRRAHQGRNFVTFINDRLSGFEPADATVMTSVLTSSQD